MEQQIQNILKNRSSFFKKDFKNLNPEKDIIMSDFLAGSFDMNSFNSFEGIKNFNKESIKKQLQSNTQLNEIFSFELFEEILEELKLKENIESASADKYWNEILKYIYLIQNDLFEEVVDIQSIQENFLFVLKNLFLIVIIEEQELNLLILLQ